MAFVTINLMNSARAVVPRLHHAAAFSPRVLAPGAGGGTDAQEPW